MVQKKSAKVLERKRKILHAAASQFRDKGFSGTGMRDVAGTLGMTVGNLYYYFESKEALLGFCQEEAIAHLLDLADRVASLEEHGPGVRLYLLARGHVVCLNELLPGSLAHMQVEDLSAAWRERIDAQRDRYEEAWRAVIREGIASGLFSETDVKVAALAMLGAVNWTVKWFRPDGPRTADEIGCLFAAQLVRGLLAPGRVLEIPDVELPRPNRDRNEEES